MPVFAGFSGGLGVLTGNTGGYIVGFLFSALVMWGMEKAFGKSRLVLGISMVLGLLACYTVGTVWFMVVYAQGAGSVALMTVLMVCHSFCYSGYDKNRGSFIHQQKNRRSN